MKRFIVPLLAAVIVVSIIFAGCMPGAAPEAPPAAPPEAPPEAPPAAPPEAPPAAPPEAPPEAPPPVVEEEKLQFTLITAGDLANPWIAELARGWNAAMETLEVEGTIGLGEFDESKTVSLVDAAVAAEPDGLLVHVWYDPTGITPPIRRGIDKGMNIVKISPGIPGFSPEELPLVGIDIVAQGYTVGRYVAAQLKAKGLVSDVYVACFLETLASPVEMDRRKGFLNALTDEGIEYTHIETAGVGMDLAGAIDMIKTYLLANLELDVIMGAGSVGTPAAVMALQDLGYAPGEVLWAGVDLVPENVAGVRAGYGAVNCDEIFSYGFLGATTLYLRAKYGLIIGNLPVNTVMVDQTNVDKYAD